MSMHPEKGTVRGPVDRPRSTSGGLALPPRQAAPLPRPVVAVPLRPKHRVTIVASITGAAVALGVLGRAVAVRASS